MLQNGVIPRVEKGVLELETTLQKYSRISDPMELDKVTDQVDEAIEEAINFITTVTSMYNERMYRIDDRRVKSGKWWKPELWYPCLLDSHAHELFQCETFLAMSPKDRQQALKGKIFKSCLKQGGGCIGKDKKCGTEVTKGFLCPGCISFTATQNPLSPPLCPILCKCT